MKIFAQHVFSNDMGQMLHSRTEVDERGAPIGKSTFHSVAMLQLLVNGVPMNRQFEFDVPGVTVGEAFANFADAMEVGRKKTEDAFKAEMRAASRQVVIPGSGQMLPPAGRPKTRFQ